MRAPAVPLELAPLRLEGPARAAVAATLVATGAVVAAGPDWVLIATLGLAVTWICLPRPALALAALASVNFLSVTELRLWEPDLLLSEVTKPLRPAALVLFAGAAVLVGGRFARGARLHLLMPVAVAVAASIALAPVVPVDAENAPAFVLMLASCGIFAAAAVLDPELARRALVGVAAVYGALVVANFLLLPLTPNPTWLAAADGNRFQGALENPNTIGALGAGGVPLLIGAGLLCRRGTARAIFWALSVLLAIQVMLSISRAGIAGLSAGGIVLLAYLTRGQLGVRAAIVGASALIAGGLLIFGDLESRLRLDTIAEGSGRIEVWSQVVESIGDRPLLGFGYGSSPQVIGSYNISEAVFVGDLSGNVVLDAGLELGIMGLIALALYLGAALRSRPRRPRLSARAPIDVVWLTAWTVVVAGLVEAQGESILLAPGGAGVVLFWLAVSFCIAFGYRAPPVSAASRTGPVPSP